MPFLPLTRAMLALATVFLATGFVVRPVEAGVIVNRSLYLGLERGLVGWWTFDGKDLSGVQAYDRSGNGNRGTLTSGPVCTIGKMGQGLGLDGVDDYMSLPNIAELFGTEASLVMWVKVKKATPTDQFKTGLVWLGRDNSCFNSHYPWTDGQIYCSVFRLNDKAIFNASSAVNRTEWHMLAVTQKLGANGYNAYQNDINVFSGTGEATVTLQGSQLIGRSRDGYYIDGLTDDVRIYNRVLSADEIKRLYRLGNSGG